MKITYSSELMKNYQQSNVISPQKKFKALQTEEGDALLFSIGTDNKFYLIEQDSKGKTKTGWREVDLSSRLAVVIPEFWAKDFDVGQNPSSGVVDLVLVMTNGSTDMLYFSSGHPNKQNCIGPDSVVWTAMVFDDPRHLGTTLQIEDVFIRQSAQTGEYVVADVSQSSFDPPSNFLKRYYIDPSKESGTFWNQMVTGGDLKPGIQSCVGRKSDQLVDGTYTLGKIGGVTELLYAPLYNPFNKIAPPTTSRLIVPPNSSAFDVCTNVDGTTDMFVVAGDDVYFFAANKQQDGASGTKVTSNGIFQGTVELHAYKSSTKYIVWGLDQADQVFYTSCAIDDVFDSSKWTVPLPIIKGVDKISSFVNRADDANTIFSAGVNEVNISIQSPTTTIWKTQTIKLEAPPTVSTTSFSSYTTRVLVNDDDNNPYANQEVLVSASSPTPVYINHLHYRLTKTPIAICSDDVGSLTIIEATNCLNGTNITIGLKGGPSVTVDVTAKPLNKISSLDTKASLKNAVITNSDGSTKPLVGSSVSDKDLDGVANANRNLKAAYDSLVKDNKSRSNVARQSEVRSSSLGGIFSPIGDLFQWLETGIEHVVKIIQDEITGLWHFVVSVAGEIYHGILDCVEAVAKAVRWVYYKIKIAIEDLIKFLEFLFEWKDITRTKKVMKNMVKEFLRNEINQIPALKKEFNAQINQLISSINGWAGIDDWSGLGQAASKSLSSSSQPNAGNSAPGDMMAYHMKAQIENAQFKDPAPLDPGTSLMKTLLGALENEGKVLDEVFTELYKVCCDFQKLSLTNILKKLIAVIADGALESAQVVIDTLFDIFYETSSAMLDLLDTKLHIPVVSDILNSFGVSDVSFMDLFAWVGAIFVTLTYKAKKGKAPFPDNADSTMLENASWEQIQNAFIKKSNVEQKALVRQLAQGDTSKSTGALSLSDSAKSAVFICGHEMSGFFSLMLAFISPLEAMCETGENPFSIPSAVLAVFSGATRGIADYLVPVDPIKNEGISIVNSGTTILVILSKFFFYNQKENFSDDRATEAVVNSVLVIPALACTCWHFSEIAKDSESNRNAAIVGETSNLTSYIGRISYTVAVNAKDPDSKVVAVVTLAAANVITGGLQTAMGLMNAGLRHIEDNGGVVSWTALEAQISEMKGAQDAEKRAKQAEAERQYAVQNACCCIIQ